MYQLIHYSQYDYNLLKSIKFNKYKGGNKDTYIKKGVYNNAVIMLDTETSKSAPNTYNEKGEVVPVVNYVVAFSISIRYKGVNYCTLYGNRPSECIDCINRIRSAVIGDLFIYIHNLPYDWQFLRKFFISAFDEPKKQLCLKSHKPIVFELSSLARLLWAIPGFLYFHTNCEAICSSSVKNTIGSLQGIALNL